MLGGRRGIAIGWDIENIQIVASGRLGGISLGGVMCDMVPINDVLQSVRTYFIVTKIIFRT